MKTRSKTPTLLFCITAAALFAPAVSWQSTGFNQYGAVPVDYDDTTNWVGGAINGIWYWSLTLSAAQGVTYESDLALSTGLVFVHAGDFALTLRGCGSNCAITL